MSKGVKYTIIVLASLAAILGVLYFVFGSSSSEVEYKITFNSNGGSEIEGQVVKKGERVSKPTDPTKENYTFVRWLYENSEYDFTKEVTSDMTLVAEWEESSIKYDVKFTLDGKDKTISVSKLTDSDLGSLGFAEKSGYEIKWYLNDKEFDLNTELTENITLVGKYVKVTTYIVRFNSNGGNTVASQSVIPNEKAKEPNSITKYGFIFDGWYLNDKKYDFDTPVTKSINLVAKWSEDPNVKRYEVTFDSDGGTTVTKQTIIDGNKATEPKAPTKKGYSFQGWYLNDTKYDFKTKVTKNITLKAKWQEAVSYTVTFNSNGGSTVEKQVVKKGEKATKPKDPTKEGYTFSTWLLDNKTFDFNTVITKDITLTARYTANKPSTIAVTSVSLSKNTVTLTADDNEKLTATVNPSDATDKTVTWTSSNSSVASVDQNGNVTAVSAGNATITATAGGKSASCTVTVNAKVTYSLEWKLVSGSVVEQYKIYIKASNGNYVSGKARLYLVGKDESKVIDVSSTGSRDNYFGSVYDKTRSTVVSVD